MAERFDTDLVEGSCPYCGEPVGLIVDPGLTSAPSSASEEQRYIEDCEVCCRPMQVHLVVTEFGTPVLTLTAEDDC